MTFPENKEGQVIIIKGLATDMLSLRFPHLKEVQRKAKEVGLYIAPVSENNHMEAVGLLEDVLRQINPNQLSLETLDKIETVLQEYHQLKI